MIDLTSTEIDPSLLHEADLDKDLILINQWCDLGDQEPPKQAVWVWRLRDCIALTIDEEHPFKATLTHQNEKPLYTFEISSGDPHLEFVERSDRVAGLFDANDQSALIDLEISFDELDEEFNPTVEMTVAFTSEVDRDLFVIAHGAKPIVV